MTVGCHPSSLLKAAAESQHGFTSSEQQAHSFDPEPSWHSFGAPEDLPVKHMAPFCTAVDAEALSLHSLAAHVAAGLALVVPHAHTPLKVGVG